MNWRAIWALYSSCCLVASLLVMPSLPPRGEHISSTVVVRSGLVVYEVMAYPTLLSDSSTIKSRIWDFIDWSTMTLFT